MRKTTIPIILLAFSFSLISCDKEYDCECVDPTGNSIGGTGLHAVSTSMAKKKCDKYEEKEQANNPYDIVCALK